MSGTPTTADLVFVNGAVYTVDAARSWARSVAVKDGRIIAVGPMTPWGRSSGRRRRWSICGGRMLLPGFQDAHVHPVGGGLEMRQCDLNELATAEAYLDAIGTYARASGAAVDPGRGMVPGRLPRRDSRRRRRWTRSWRTGPCSCPTATATAPG